MALFNHVLSRSHIVLCFLLVAWISCASSFGFAASPASWRGQSVSEFTPAENKKFAWQIVNDGVMGGLSKGNVEHTAGNTMHFWGTLSLDNNGGFSTVRSRSVNFDLSNDLGLLLLVKGDGRTYEARLDSTAKFRGNPISFSGKFKTKKDQWIQVKVPFEGFVASWRGRQFPDEVLDTTAIQRVSILLADKKSGPFDLEIEWIRTYGKGQGRKQKSVENVSAQPKHLIATVVDDGRLTIFKQALDVAKLTVFFQWDNPLTVFAPTDDAFSNLPEGLLEELLKPDNREKLVTLLSYHVVAGSFDAKQALEEKNINMVQGGKVNVTSHSGKVHANDAVIIEADIQCVDGIIHTIDAVLIPENSE
jgi:NADH dehydrogenase [ubiquinone] 1 alpha subcomplex assembly factor 1